MLLADPPNQKGYRIEGACFCSFFAVVGFSGVGAATSFCDCMVQLTRLEAISASDCSWGNKKNGRRLEEDAQNRPVTWGPSCSQSSRLRSV